MNIYEFFSQRSGLWMCQCTSRNLVTQASSNHRQKIKVELLAPDRLQICGDQPKRALTALPEGEGLRGKLLLHHDQGEYQGEFRISRDGVLSLTIVNGGDALEEKLWFPLPNLCMRTVCGQNHAQFWTEVRKLS